MKLKITPPRKGKKVGVLSTRSPHRPNPLGLSVCKIVSVDFNAGILTLSGVDLLDGTPILDIKPYTISDVVLEKDLLMPEWVSPNNDIENKQVNWSD